MPRKVFDELAKETEGLNEKNSIVYWQTNWVRALIPNGFGGGRLRRKAVGTLMLLLFLTSMISGIFITRPTQPPDAQSTVPQGNSAAGIPSTGPFGSSVQQKGAQGKLSEKSVPSSSSSDTWDFNNVSQWNSLAYMDGNKTRLIVGVDSSKPDSIIQLETLAAKDQARVVNSVSMGGKARAFVVELLFSSVPFFVGEVQRLDWHLHLNRT